MVKKSDAHGGSPHDGDLYVEAFARGLAVIRAFGPDSREMTLTDVAGRAGLHPAGARRLLHTLVALGYAGTRGRLFHLTPAVLDLGYSYLSSLSLRDAAIPNLESFAREYGEICSLSVLSVPDIVYVARAEIRSPSARRIITGERLPAHATAAGQVLLASMPQAALDQYLAGAHAREKLTANTITEAAPLRAAIEAARAKGYGMAVEEYELGVCAVAVPVANRDGTVVAAVATSLNMAKHQAAEAAGTFVPRLQGVALAIGRALVA